MRTAIDTNVVSALWSNEPASTIVAQQLGSAKIHGALLVSPVVYGELLAYPKATESFVNNFLSDTGIAVDFEMHASTWSEAGRRFAQYAAARRRKEEVGGPKRLLADFLIGSHALLQADRLMTLDASRYKQYFPELKLV